MIYKATLDYEKGQESELEETLNRPTNSSTFSSNFSPSFVLSVVGENNVQPDNSVSPSSKTRDTQVAMASARMFDNRMSSRGSVDCNFNKNSEKTEIVRKPSM